MPTETVLRLGLVFDHMYLVVNISGYLYCKFPAAKPVVRARRPIGQSEVSKDWGRDWMSCWRRLSELVTMIYFPEVLPVALCVAFRPSDIFSPNRL